MLAYAIRLSCSHVSSRQAPSSCQNWPVWIDLAPAPTTRLFWRLSEPHAPFFCSIPNPGHEPDPFKSAVPEPR